MNNRFKLFKRQFTNCCNKSSNARTYVTSQSFSFVHFIGDVPKWCWLWYILVPNKREKKLNNNQSMFWNCRERERENAWLHSTIVHPKNCHFIAIIRISMVVLFSLFWIQFLNSNAEQQLLSSKSISISQIHVRHCIHQLVWQTVGCGQRETDNQFDMIYTWGKLTPRISWKNGRKLLQLWFDAVKRHFYFTFRDLFICRAQTTYDLIRIC